MTPLPAAPTYILQAYPLWVAEVWRYDTPGSPALHGAMDTAGTADRVIGWMVQDTGWVRPVTTRRALTDEDLELYFGDTEREAIDHATYACESGDQTLRAQANIKS